MKRNRRWRASVQEWAARPEALSGEARLLAEEAGRLARLRKTMGRVNLSLIGVLLVVHLVVKVVHPGFPAAEYLAIEIASLEGVASILARRLGKKEDGLGERFRALPEGGQRM